MGCPDMGECLLLWLATFCRCFGETLEQKKTAEYLHPKQSQSSTITEMLFDLNSVSYRLLATLFNICVSFNARCP